MQPGQKMQPIKTYAETDVLRDSDIWEYLKYLQMNRINFIATTIWDTDRQAKNQLLNLIGAVNQLEFLCWDKIRLNSEKKDKYLDLKPQIFKDMQEDTSELHTMINSNQMTQMQLLLFVTDWLKVLDVWLSGMKKMRKTAFISGVGEVGEETPT